MCIRDRYKKGLPKARNKLTDEMWNKYIYHKDEDRFIGAIFATVYTAVGTLRAAEHKQYNLKRKEKRDLSSDQTMFGRVFTYVMQAVSYTHLDVYKRQILHRLIDSLALAGGSIEEIREAWAELGKLYSDRIMRPQDAIKAWQKVFEINKKDFRALDALEALFNQESQWEDAVNVIEKRVKLLDKDSQKIAELLKICLLYTS